MARPELTPCIVCEKAVLYLWTKEQAGNATNLNGACDVSILAGYGSIFDCNEYTGVICDNCIDHLIQSRRVRFVKEHPLFGN